MLTNANEFESPSPHGPVTVRQTALRRRSLIEVLKRGRRASPEPLQRYGMQFKLLQVVASVGPDVLAFGGSMPANFVTAIEFGPQGPRSRVVVPASIRPLLGPTTRAP